MYPVNNTLTTEVLQSSPFESGEYHLPCKALPDSASAAEIVSTQYFSAAGQGAMTSMVFQSDFYMTLYNGVYSDRAASVRCSGDGWYLLTLRISGDTQESIAQQAFSVDPYSCSMIYYADQRPHDATIEQGRCFVEVDIYFRQSVLANKMPGHSSHLNQCLAAQSGDHRLGVLNVAMVPAIEKTVRELLQFDLGSPVYLLYAQAKALELIAGFIAHSAVDTAGHNGSGHPLTQPKNRQQLYFLKDYLDSHYQESHTLNDLCRLVAFNRRKLTEQFKAVFGMTVHQYLQTVRIDNAKAMLRQGDSVSAVAHQVGYAYQSNFAKVFRQQVGLSPKDFGKLSRGAKPGEVWPGPE